MLRIDRAANQWMLDKAVQACQSILKINANPRRPSCAISMHHENWFSNQGSRSKAKKGATHSYQLPKKLILTRKLTIPGESKCHFLKFKVKKLTIKSSFTLSAHASGVK
jgi:hypothetical protein